MVYRNIERDLARIKKIKEKNLEKNGYNLDWNYCKDVGYTYCHTCGLKENWLILMGLIGYLENPRIFKNY